MPDPTPPTPPGLPKPETLGHALKALKQPLKFSSLDDKSALGHGPLSSGRASGIVAITPSNQYPGAVWDKLVAQGKPKYAGQGLYKPVNR